MVQANGASAALTLVLDRFGEPPDWLLPNGNMKVRGVVPGTSLPLLPVPFNSKNELDGVPAAPVGPAGPATVEAAPVGPIGPATDDPAPVGPVGPATVDAGPVDPLAPEGP